ncbi:hypothetical protein DdX_00053 [Ditylenchus destructor]|uniref:Uncharacterized protein n=1 Tax=Ditylenchus destructor TaxID=166010 RepID=A0AAD4RCP4_9BILA|nr:hypothetical protein DdX_00053 [Ditylenchus destructor]
MATECMYTVVPIKGMEFIQKNFAKYQHGERSAEEFLAGGRPTLAKRFQLIERGFSLQLNKESLNKPIEPSKKVIMKYRTPTASNDSKENSSTDKVKHKPKRSMSLPKKVRPEPLVLANQRRPMAPKQETEV